MKLIEAFYLYHFLSFIGSFFRNTKQIKVREDIQGKKKFLALIFSHNEEKIIKNSIKSLKRQEYPGEIDIIVVADNCNDSTRKIAENLGSKVLERKSELKGKQYALMWVLKRINLSEYYAVAVFDADNIVDRKFFSVMEAGLEKYDVIQGYVETYNKKSWLSGSYALMYYYMQRLISFKNSIGLTAWLGGKGWVAKTEVIRKLFPDLKTLVDDVEYTTQLLLNGYKVGFAKNAVVYDLQPDDLLVSIKQRARWTQGQTQVFLYYLWPMVKSLFSFIKAGEFLKAVRIADALMWLPMNLFILYSFFSNLFINAGGYILGLILTTPLMFYLIALAEKRSLKDYFYSLFSGVFFITWIPATMLGIQRMVLRQNDWFKTPK